MDTRTCTLEVAAEQVARGFIHHLAPAFRPPARLVCPSDEAEHAVVNAVMGLDQERDVAALMTLTTQTAA